MKQWVNVLVDVPDFVTNPGDYFRIEIGDSILVICVCLAIPLAFILGVMI